MATEQPVVIDERKLRLYINMVETGRRDITAVPEPYQTEVRKALNLPNVAQ